MKIEIPDEIVDDIIADQLNKTVVGGRGVIDGLESKESLEQYEQDDLEYYKELVAAAIIVRRHFTVNE